MIGDIFRKIKKDQNKNSNYLSNLIIENLYYEREKEISPESWFSPSQLSIMCHRAYSIAWKLGLPFIDPITVNSRWRMDVGSAIHSLIQDMWGGEQGWLIGGWKCTECGHVVGYDPDDKTPIYSHGEWIKNKVTLKSAISRPEGCEKCGMVPGWRRGFSFVEPLCYDLNRKTSGLTDGIIKHIGYEIIDIKTTRSLYYYRNGPSRHHVIQLNWYLDMMGIKKGRIVYVDRSARYVSEAFLEYQINYDLKLMSREKEKLLDLRERFKEEKQIKKLSACPHDGKTPWGPCQCKSLEDAWKTSCS